MGPMYESKDNIDRRIEEHTKIFEAALPEVPAMESEIERSFLIDFQAIPYDLSTLVCHEIQQGYIAIDGETEVRLRLKDDDALITIKQGTGNVRKEHEYAIPSAEAPSLLAMAGDRIVTKTRYIISQDAYRIELDVFKGAHTGLILAEVEFADEASSDEFVAPAWFGQEVTEDTRYMNRNLAVHGLPQ